MPRGSNPVTLDDMITDKVDLEDRIKRLKKKKVELKRQITEEIDTLDDPRHCEVLEAFFIDCLSLEDIADKEGYTVRHVYRIYSEAVRLLALNRQ
jgi:DNA-directed RNA polymerase specialized sigma subunit